MADENNKKNIEEILKEVSEIKKVIEETAPPSFKDYLTDFCIIFAGLYSIVRSLWWIYQRLITKKNLDEMMTELEHLPKKNKNKK